MGEQYRKENVKIMGDMLSPGVCWREEKGKENGLVFNFKIREMTGENEKMRDKLLDRIMEVQKKGKEDDMGFGLFD